MFIIERVFYFHHNFVLEANFELFIMIFYMSLSSRRLILGFLLRYFIKMSFSNNRLLLKILLLSFLFKSFLL